MSFDINSSQYHCVMHCKTREEALEFCKFLDSENYRWATGKSYLDYCNWQTHEEDTCYNYRDGKYQTVEYYQRANYTILEWSNFSDDKSIFYGNLLKEMRKKSI